MAPATKYGGKKVPCHPGTIAIVKSKLTTVCTESTSGVASPASNSVAVSYTLQCRAEPRQPIAITPYTTRATRLWVRSRSVARSGIRPTYQNSSDTVAYVETANTSHTSGLRKFGCTPMVLGYGNNQ